MSKNLSKAVLAALGLAAMAGGVHAAGDQPLWEIGAGAAAFSFPLYRGSDQTHNFFMPVPHFTYHGDFLKADRQGIRGSFFDSDRVDLTVSLALSPPVSSDDITARAGMPDLEGTFEIGPQMDVTFWRSENRARFVKLLLPLRAAITVQGSPKDIGWVFHPKLNMDITDIPGMAGWNLGMLAGPLFGDKRQHAYYYSVAPQYATADRPAYEAKAGYAGMQYLVALSKRFPKYWVGGFVRYDNLSGATFEDSPLVRQKDYFAAGVAFTWVFGESSTRVKVDD
ncbi:MAG: MipA/OmpV family protein [Gammaproteobacteria bacterium]|nr:MipA/OmpV family protein [Gammaproteobacteria bacterium]MBU1600917.1 MipA/OmpV family protein [Gammaproteobacteria bacterium]MBU2435373.1 MipA/OmpV family protein [Gammaproteobacteria bacterium]MBU2448787.1 MipA/OmpV family protein [Gammaproteobacteria bacterium]